MQTTRYVYDTYGRISQVKLGDTKVRDYFYTDGGDLSYIKDYRGFETADSTAYIKESFEYDSIGAVIKLTYTDFANESATGVKKEEYALSYDNNGNILTESAYTNYGEAKTINKSYEYDVIGRLTKSTIDGVQTSYTYDKVGNRLSQTSGGETLSYTYNNLDQLLNIKSGSDTISTFVYDARGNQISEETLAFTLSIGDAGSLGYESKDHYTETEYTYDLRNQLIGVETITPVAAEEPEDVDDVTTSTVITTNKFNAAGKRIERIEDGTTTRFYYSGEALLYSTDELNVLQTENILDPAGSIIASKRFLLPHLASSQEFANKYYFYHYDVRSSVTNIIGPDGNVVKGYEYDDFGNTENTGNNSFINDVTFTSSVSDTQSGLQYMNARFYQPATGRFLSQDTYTGNAYDPWTQNLYSYCGNNPLNYIDPTGHSIDDIKRELPGLKERLATSTYYRDYYRNNRFNYEYGSYMYNWMTNQYHFYRDDVIHLKGKIAESKDFINLQHQFNIGNIKNIHQGSYSNIPLYEKSTVAKTGCGYIAALITAYNLGDRVDVHDAYLIINKPENEFFNTGTVAVNAIEEYLNSRGYFKADNTDFSMSPKGVFVTSIMMQKKTGIYCHYLSLLVEKNVGITTYNSNNTYKNALDYIEDNDIVMTFTLDLYRKKSSS